MPIFYGCEDEQTARNRAANTWNGGGGRYLGFDPQYNLYVYQTYTGYVINTTQRTHSMDSFYTEYGADVWDVDAEGNGRIVNIGYYCDRDENARAWAIVDATPDVLEAVARQKREAREREERHAQRVEDCTPRVGKRLEVIKGRKVPKGTVGECMWLGHGTWGTRVGIRDAAGNVHWTAIDNVQVI